MSQSTAALDEQNTSGGSIEDAAAAAPMEIEETAAASLQEVVDGYTPSYNPDNAPADIADGHFTFHLNTPIPELNSSLAEAFKVSCSEPLAFETYGLVLSHHHPHRKRAAEELVGLKNPHLCQVEYYGTARLSRGETRTVTVLQKPVGKPLSALINSGVRLHEKQVMDQVLTPLCSALMAMQEKDVSHGRIHPENLYLSDKIMLGECVSEPSGYSQPYLFEPAERILTQPYGKGACSESSDVYALGMLTYALMFGIEKFEQLSRTQLASLLLEFGSYNAFTPNVELSESMEDFFRGIFNENKQERWRLEQLQSWLEGKRFNLIHPSIPRESSRAFTFKDKDYFNQRALANGLASHWQTATKELGAMKLDRWLDTSAHKAEEAEAIARWLPSENERTALHNTSLTKIIATLDPTGPMRLQSIASNIDGVGATLCDLFRNNQRKEINDIHSLLHNDIPGFLSAIDTSPKVQDTHNTLWRLEKTKQYINSKTLGFGTERLLYDLNPSLPCQSPMLLRYHITDLQTMINTLDFVAKDRGLSNSLLDRHLAAFVASRLDLTREIRIAELAHIPSIAANKELLVLKLLGQAQEKVKGTHTGLASWVAMRVSDSINAIHNRKLRREMRSELTRAAKTGRIAYVLGILFNPDIANKDQHGFAKASHIYAVTEQKISHLQHRGQADRLASELGARIAVVTAYLILSVTSYFVLHQYMGW